MKRISTFYRSICRPGLWPQLLLLWAGGLLLLVLGPLLLAGATLCPLRSLTGLPCPGCGTLAGLRQLLGGQLPIQPLAYAAALALMLAPLAAWADWRAGGSLARSLQHTLAQPRWRAGLLLALAAQWAWVLWKA